MRAAPRTAAPAGPVPGALALATAASLLAQQMGEAFGWSGPEDGVSLSLFAAAQVGAVALGLAVLGEAGRRHLIRRRLATTARHVREAPTAGRLGAAVARVLGDSTAEVRYWAADREEFVDAEGRVRPPPGRHDGVAVRITRGGRFLAVLVGRGQADAAAVHRALGPSLRLALENEQLRAASLAELGEIQRSRVRIAERAGEERRRLERNLHDGAQQQVVALVLRLRMLRAVVPDDAAGPVVAAERAAARLLEDLRRLARGIHPAVVTDSGLAEALVDLAEDSTDVVVSVSGVPGDGLSVVAQTTTYEVVAGALADARRRGATRFDVRAGVRETTLALEICDDAPGRERAGLGEVAERVRALSGRISHEPSGGGSRLLLEVPCAS